MYFRLPSPNFYILVLYIPASLERFSVYDFGRGVETSKVGWDYAVQQRKAGLPCAMMASHKCNVLSGGIRGYGN
jgi:hypothetical protein